MNARISPTRTVPSRSALRRRFTMALAATVGVAGLGLGLTACGDDQPADSGTVATGEPAGEIRTVSAADGAAARSARDAALGVAGGAAQDSARLASPEAAAMIAGSDAMPIDCGIGGEPYVPSPEEIAAANADTDALAAVFDTYGIAFERITDDLGFAYLEWDFTDVVAQSVNDSFWQDRYPPQPIPVEELERIRSENDAIAAALDAAGVSYTRNSDDAGYEWIEWDYEDPAAQAAVEAVYAELYPPVPPAPEEIERIRTENDALAAAFDAAGIAYERIADDAGWEWIEWDWEDQAANDVAQGVYSELYPMPEPGPDVCAMPLAEGELVDPAVVRGRDGDAPTGGGADGEASMPPVEETEPPAPGDATGGDPGDGTVTDPVEAPAPGEPGVSEPGDPGTGDGTPTDPVEAPAPGEPGDSEPGDPGVIVDDVVVEEVLPDDGAVAEEAPRDVVVEGEVGADGEVTIMPIEDGFTPEQEAQRAAEVQAMADGFAAAGVEHEVIGESPWATVVFDIDDPAAVEVIAAILAARG